MLSHQCNCSFFCEWLSSGALQFYEIYISAGRSRESFYVTVPGIGGFAGDEVGTLKYFIAPPAVYHHVFNDANALDKEMIIVSIAVRRKAIGDTDSVGFTLKLNQYGIS